MLVLAADAATMLLLFTLNLVKTPQKLCNKQANVTFTLFTSINIKSASYSLSQSYENTDKYQSRLG